MHADFKFALELAGERGDLSFSNGDLFNGTITEEEGKVWFQAVDGDGRLYETEEMPDDYSEKKPAPEWNLTVEVRPAYTIEEEKRAAKKEAREAGRFIPSSFKRFEGA
jgi:hypothetical protein